MKITAKLRKFIYFYARCNDAKKAALEAGYSQSMAAKCAYKWTHDPDVKVLIDEENERVIKEAHLTKEWFLERCMRVVDVCSTPVKRQARNGKEYDSVVDASGAAKMAAVLKDALPEFKQKIEHSVTEGQEFKIGDQTIKF